MTFNKLTKLVNSNRANSLKLVFSIPADNQSIKRIVKEVNILSNEELSAKCP